MTETIEVKRLSYIEEKRRKKKHRDVYECVEDELDGFLRFSIFPFLTEIRRREGKEKRGGPGPKGNSNRVLHFPFFHSSPKYEEEDVPVRDVVKREEF